MKIDRSVKIGVISSIIATIIFIYLLEPILSLVGRFVFDSTLTLMQTYRNTLFIDIALSRPFEPSLFLLGMVMVTSLTIAIGFTVTVFVELRHAKATDDNESFVATNIHLTSALRMKYFLAALVTVIVILTIHVLYKYTFTYRAITSFEQHIAAIKPFTNDHDIDLLRSKWALMKSESDFNAIRKDLTTIADRNNIVLPDNPLY